MVDQKTQEDKEKIQMSGRKKCPDCGTPYDEKEDFFCGVCGKYLKEIEEEQSSTVDKRKERISQIKTHLAPDEKVLAMFITALGEVEWYATTKRVIKFQQGLFGKKMVSLPYSHISSLALETANYLWLIGIGIPLLIGGWFLKDEIFRLIAGVFGGLIGIALIILGISMGTKTYYKFTGSGLDEKEWTMEYDSKQKEIEGFIQVVEKKIG